MVRMYFASVINLASFIASIIGMFAALSAFDAGEIEKAKYYVLVAIWVRLTFKA